MKKVLVSFALFLGLWSRAQTSIKIYNEDATSVPYTKIMYRVLNTQTKNYVLTNINGEVNIPKTNLDTPILIIIDQLGYHVITDTIQANSLKTYKLIPESIMTGEICVTGEYEATTTSQSINKTTIISREDIINSGASTLSDILTYQSNIRIQQDNVLGSGMSMNGMSGENVKILQNGVPVIGRLNGNIDLSQINLDEVERIEIVNGPLSVNYGTNALAGTVNVITRKNTHPGFKGSMLGMYESVGNYNLTGNLNYTFKKHTFKLSGGRKYFDGWRPDAAFWSYPQETIADTNRFLSWNPKLQYIGELNYVTDIKNWKISPYFRYYQEKITNRGYPKSPYFETAFDDYYYTTRIDQGLTVDRVFKKGNLNFVGGYNYFKRIKNTYLKDLTTLNENLTGNTSDQDTSLFDLIIARGTYSSSFKNWFTYQVGTDINVETATGKRIEDNKQLIGDYTVFGSAVITILNDKLDIKPGARYAYNTVFRAPVTPSLNLKYQLPKDVQLRASVAQGFRSPTLKELYFNFVDINHNIVGNLNLKPENSLNFNGGVTWIKPIKSRDLFKAEVSAFYNDFQNLITLGLKDDGGFTYINIGTFSTVGGQGQLSYRTKKMRIQSNLTYIGRYNFVKDENLDPYIFSPEVSTTASYKLLKDKISINVFYKYNGQLINYRVNDNDIQISTASDFHILDLSVSTYLMDRNCNLIFGVKNLLNVQNINISGGSVSGGAHSTSANSQPIGRGTSIFLSMNYQFKHYKTAKSNQNVKNRE